MRVYCKKECKYLNILYSLETLEYKVLIDYLHFLKANPKHPIRKFLYERDHSANNILHHAVVKMANDYQLAYECEDLKYIIGLIVMLDNSFLLEKNFSGYNPENLVGLVAGRNIIKDCEKFAQQKYYDFISSYQELSFNPYKEEKSIFEEIFNFID